MEYQALYRKWRPQTFDDVCGQSHITDTMKNEVINGRISHAYLFCGSRGTGKTSTARILSRAINCLNLKQGNPCNQCENCRDLLDGRIVDVTEIDAASNNGVDNIRQIRDASVYMAATGLKRIYIIDEVHMLTSSAFNAFLKLLEEPPPSCYFILATTEAHKVPDTILSRCQRFDFKRINTNDIITQLKRVLQWEHATCDDHALLLIAQKADGGMRDALSLLDQCMSVAGNNLSYDAVCSFLGLAGKDKLCDIAEAILHNNLPNALSAGSSYCDSGSSYLQLLDSVLHFFRDMLVQKIGAGETNDDRVASILDKFTYERLVYIVKMTAESIVNARGLANSKIAWELCLFKLCNTVYQQSTEAILARLAELEARSSQVVHIVPTPVTKPAPVPPVQQKPEIAPSRALNAIIRHCPEILDDIQSSGRVATLPMLMLCDFEQDGEKIAISVSENDFNVYKSIFVEDREYIEECIRRVTGATVELTFKAKKKSQVDTLNEIIELN